MDICLSQDWEMTANSDNPMPGPRNTLGLASIVVHAELPGRMGYGEVSMLLRQLSL